MCKIEKIKLLLRQMGISEEEYTDFHSYVLLSMAGIKEDDEWISANNKWLRIIDIIQFMSTNYGSLYTENRRLLNRIKPFACFRELELIENSGDINSINCKYRLTKKAVLLIKNIGLND